METSSEAGGLRNLEANKYVQMKRVESIIPAPDHKGNHPKRTTMSILKLCDEVPASVPLPASVADAIQTMLEQGVGAVVVVDENNVVAGIFTERDVLRKMALTGKDPKKVPVRELMTTPVVMATQDTPASVALEVMVREHHRHLPIVDDHARLLGLLSIRHLLEAKVDELTAQFAASGKD